MKPRLHPSPTVFLFTVILVVVVRFSAIWCQGTSRYDACGESVECGNNQLEYPFWGSDRPAYCGHMGFQLNCRSDVFILNYESVDYRVLQMDSSKKTISVARNNLWATECPQYLHNTTYNTTLFNDNNFGQEDVSLYYGCNSTVPTFPIGLSSTNEFSCNVNGTESDSYCYNI
ncbi:hypothetical protein L6452_40947 [Arctium lappa]|uniref:Uncharacterized protein n=1 Tax=Arctium lappa TaxID=4217 RepID=A0ACB8XMK8_ARCLA|nr:hypothetical protein L6452_40947 [Arctium lappa]